MNRLVIFRSDNGKWRWYVEDRVGDQIAKSKNDYQRRGDAVRDGEQVLKQIKVDDG